MDPATYPIITSVLASFMAAVALVLTAGQHGRFTMDVPGAIQTFHSRPTPRIGGVGIYTALLLASLLVQDPSARQILATILVAGIPALLVGLLEDVTKRIGVGARLVGTMISGATVCWLSGITLTHLDVPLLDLVMGIKIVALLFTAFAISGIANAINIIDGFHGLASGTTTICLLALATIAAMVGDTSLAITALLVAAAVMGFWLVNFPWGKLFLGDGGAYFAGFALAWLAVLLPARNPEVSPWASFMICAYPIIEVIYSIVRRHQSRQSASQPDRRHLHSLVATHFIQPRMANLHPTLQNAAVSVVMWLAAFLPALGAVLLHRHTDLLVISAIACVVAYHLIYRRIIRK